MYTRPQGMRYYSITRSRIAIHLLNFSESFAEVCSSHKDQMVENLYAKRFAKRFESRRKLPVLNAFRGIAAGMVVGDDD